MKLVIAFPLMLFAFAGCSSSSSSNGGGYLPVPTVHESAAPSCHDVTGVAAAITTTHVQGTLPAYTPSGGSIADGVYVLTSHTIYQPTAPEPDGTTMALTLVVDKSNWYIYLDDGPTPVRESDTVSLSATSFTDSGTCPPGGAGYFASGKNDFSASADGFTVYEASDDGLGSVSQFTRK